jgi:hypothetical protein
MAIKMSDFFTESATDQVGCLRGDEILPRDVLGRGYDRCCASFGRGSTYHTRRSHSGNRIAILGPGRNIGGVYAARSAEARATLWGGSLPTRSRAAVNVICYPGGGAGGPGQNHIVGCRACHGYGLSAPRHIAVVIRDDERCTACNRAISTRCRK